MTYLKQGCNLPHTHTFLLCALAFGRSKSRFAPDSQSEHLFQLALRQVGQNTNYMPNMRLSEIGTVSDLGTITIIFHASLFTQITRSKRMHNQSHKTFY